MERTGNSIGAEGRRQHGESDPRHGDSKRRQERLADEEIPEGQADAAEVAEAADAADAAADAAEPQADGVPHDHDSPDATPDTDAADEPDTATER